MAKGARRSFNDPKKQIEKLMIAQSAKAWKKGFITEYPGDFNPRQGFGHIGVTYDEASSWDLEALKKVMNGIELDHGEPKVEIKTDPIEDWATKWAESHAS